MELQYKSKGTNFMTYVQQVCQIHGNVKTTKGEQIWNITETIKLTAWNKQPKFGNNEGAIDPKSQTCNF